MADVMLRKRPPFKDKRIEERFADQTRCIRQVAELAKAAIDELNEIDEDLADAVRGTLTVVDMLRRRDTSRGKATSSENGAVDLYTRSYFNRIRLIAEVASWQIISVLDERRVSTHRRGLSGKRAHAVPPNRPEAKRR